MGDEVDVLPANKREGFLQVDSIKLPKTISLQYLKENMKEELGLLPTD